MIWNDHSKLKEKHALLSPSGYSWINYSPEERYEKILQKYLTSKRQEIGTVIHSYAADAISIQEKVGKSVPNLIKSVKMYFKAKGYGEEMINILSILPDHVWQTLMLYVNDCIGFRMDPEVILYYSDDCFGTTDAINFSNGILRISDLKTGDTEAHMEQLLTYAALFCLEYHFKPNDILIETRLYQFGNIVEAKPTPDIIVPLMDVITRSSKDVEIIKGKE